MTSFTINHPLINLEIKLEEIDKLHIHEEILEGLLRQLVKTIKSDERLFHPVIVDRKRLIVLDGMHRIAATKKLGCRFIPICLLDYDNPHVVIDCWYRMVNPKSKSERVTRTIEELGFTLEEHEIEEADDLVKKREAIASIAFSSKSFSIHGVQENIREIYDAIKEIEIKLGSKGYSINYDIESDARRKLALGEVFSIIKAPTLSKEEVVKAAFSGQIFSHKTTRHVIPLRPLFLNVPLKWLYSKSSSEKINEKFIKYLSTKKFKRLPPGQILDRRYDEELYVQC